MFVGTPMSSQYTCEGGREGVAEEGRGVRRRVEGEGEGVGG